MFAKPPIKWEQMINMAHKLTSLQAYNFLQVDNKDRSFRTVLLCLAQSRDAFGFLSRCLFVVDRFVDWVAFLLGGGGEEGNLYTAEEIMFRKSSILKEANVNPLKTI